MIGRSSAMHVRWTSDAKEEILYIITKACHISRTNKYSYGKFKKFRQMQKSVNLSQRHAVSAGQINDSYEKLKKVRAKQERS